MFGAGRLSCPNVNEVYRGLLPGPEVHRMVTTRNGLPWKQNRAMSTTWSKEELRRIAGTNDLHISRFRESVLDDYASFKRL